MASQPLTRSALPFGIVRGTRSGRHRDLHSARFYRSNLQLRRLSFDSSRAEEASYTRAENAILSSSLSLVPAHGFTHQALLQGSQDASYRPASVSLFTRGPFDLVMYHLITQRLALKDRVNFRNRHQDLAGDRVVDTGTLGVGAKLRMLILARLQANVPVAHKYPEALALMSLASNIPPSLAELGRLADEMWYLAGDQSLDTSWYTKRGSLAAVYAATEVFMTQDRSEGFADTEKFLDRRLEDAKRAGNAASDVGQWIGFTGISTINVLRSWGARI